MSSITIHSIEPELNERLNKLAETKGTSKNKLIKDILARSVGYNGLRGEENEYHRFCGLWSREEYEQFNAAQASNSIRRTA
ncbi:MAG: hypothetical protein ACLFQW_03695 [Spirochaetaceae bacterium]